LLLAWGQGDEAALHQMIPLVQRELHQIARRCMAGEQSAHSLQPTALVNEAYLRLVEVQQMNWQNRAHFLGVAAQMMRRILVDHARAHQAAKRPRTTFKVAFDDQIGAIQPRDVDLLALDEALHDLAAVDARLAQVMELRYFGGLSEQEVARLLSISRSTVTRDWQTARTWLYRRMTTGEDRNRP